MNLLLAVRGSVTGLLEEARTEKCVPSFTKKKQILTVYRMLRSSLEAVVDIIIPGDMASSSDLPPLIKLIQEQGKSMCRCYPVTDLTRSTQRSF